MLAVGLLLLASAAICYALTNHGARRVAGAGVAMLAVAGVIVVLATHWHGVLVLLALLVLLAAFGLAASFALGRTGEAASRRLSAALGPGGRADSAALMINLKSGGGKAERLDLAARRGEVASSRSF